MVWPQGGGAIGLTGGGNSPDIAWDASSPTPAFYNIYKATTIGGLPGSDVYAVVTGDTTTWTDFTPGTGQKYYAITSVSAGGAESAQSAPIARFF
jgi:fibronectin type 3 domain-containing protein